MRRSLIRGAVFGIGVVGFGAWGIVAFFARDWGEALFMGYIAALLAWCAPPVRTPAPHACSVCEPGDFLIRKTPAQDQSHTDELFEMIVKNYEETDFGS